MERCSHPGAHREAIKPAMQRSHVGPKSNAHATRVAFLFDRPDLTAPHKYRRHVRKLLPSAHHTHEAKRIIGTFTAALQRRSGNRSEGPKEQQKFDNAMCHRAAPNSFVYITPHRPAETRGACRQHKTSGYDAAQQGAVISMSFVGLFPKGQLTV